MGYLRSAAVTPTSRRGARPSPGFLVPGLCFGIGLGCGGADTHGAGGSTGDGGGATSSTTAASGGAGGNTLPGAGGYGNGSGSGNNTGVGGEAGWGGSAAGGSGGSGGAGGSGGGVSPEDQAICDGYCLLDACVDGVCTRPATLNVTISELEEKAATTTHSARTSVCQTQGVATFIQVLASAGECAVVKATSMITGPVTPLDPGDVTVTTDTLGTAPVTSCFAGALPPDTAFSPGDAVAFLGSGSADVPAFSIDLIAPEPVGLTTTPIQGGQPTSFSWTSSELPTYVAMAGEDVLLFCVPTLPPPLIVDGSLTALLASSPKMLLAFAPIMHLAQTDFDGAGPVLLVGATATTNVYTSYSP